MSTTVLIPTANTVRAIKNANDAVGQGAAYSGMCEKFTRTCYEFPARFGSARLAYQAALADGGIVPGDGSDAPAGSVMFWDILTGVNVNFDHVAPVTATGICNSTSAGPGRTVAKVRITDLTARWGMRPLGWTTIYHHTLLFVRKEIDEGGETGDEGDDTEEDEMKYQGYSTEKKCALPNGSWRTLLIDDDGRETFAGGAGPFQALAQIRAEGLPPGEPMQVRFKVVDTKSGEDAVRKSTYPTTEIVGTSGQTFGQAVQYGSLSAPASGWTRRLRAEVLVYVDDVVITYAAGRTFH